MKKLSLLIITLILFSGMVLAGSGLWQKDYFYDESDQDVTGVQSELYDEDKNHVHSKNSGDSNSITFEYPHTGTEENPDIYEHFFFKDCYLPLEATEEVWGTGEHLEFSNTFEKASSCRSPIDTFSIKNDEHPNEPIIVDVDATLSADAHSAFTDARHNWFPSGYEEHYSAETKITVEILHEGDVIHTDSKTKYIMMDDSENVQFSWTPGMEGEFTARVTTDVIDCQCESSSTRQSSKDFEIWSDQPYDECYTLIQELAAQPEFPEVGDNLDISFEKISNYADENNEKTPVQTDVDYVITDSGNNVVFEEQETLPANSDGENYESHSFNWEPSQSGDYNIRVTGVADSSMCDGKNNPEDTANLGITVDDEEKYSVTFEVTDSESGNSISGASVSLGKQSGTTNSAGEVSFDKSPGTYDWDVTAQDYSSESGSVDVTNKDETVQVSLEPVVDEHTVTFNVIDASTGFAIQGADVELGSYSETTNSNGRVVFDNVEEGNYDWDVSKDGYHSVADSVTVDDDEIID
ncbi:MAG: MSCRAMM family protein, partial [Candidatus Nanoarchaeia archaeon]